MNLNVNKNVFYDSKLKKEYIIKRVIGRYVYFKNKTISGQYKKRLLKVDKNFKLYCRPIDKKGEERIYKYNKLDLIYINLRYCDQCSKLTKCREMFMFQSPKCNVSFCINNSLHFHSICDKCDNIRLRKFYGKWK